MKQQIAHLARAAGFKNAAIFCVGAAKLASTPACDEYFYNIRRAEILQKNFQLIK